MIIMIKKAINHKCIVKVQPFRSENVQCMYNHVKPTILDVNLDNITFHVNELNSKKSSSQNHKIIY